MDTNEFCVDESAFWHSSMDLYYGFQTGEVLEVEHESNKYWMATIVYSYRHLLLLKWVGDYGDFWVDSSLLNSTSNSNSVLDEFNTPKRLYQPGYHLQSQLKSHFILEEPTNVLIKPSLYNPANDPYAEIKTVEDLLALEVDSNDTFGEKTSASSNEPASLVMAKCKTKIAYGQEDVDELEAALQNLNEIDSDKIDSHNESPDTFNLINGASNKTGVVTSNSIINKQDTPEQSIQTVLIKQESCVTQDSNILNESKPTLAAYNEDETKAKSNRKLYLDKLMEIQNDAFFKGRYVGIGEHSKNIYYLKPKSLFDIGGANHEKVLVPGALLEISHTISQESGLKLCHWFAIVLKNVGGRLTMRWFLCDDPKFKQGRLELKSCKSQFIQEDEDTESSDDNKDDEMNRSKSKLTAKNITFCMHFCNPSVHSVLDGSKLNRSYDMPRNMFSLIEETRGREEATLVEKQQYDIIADWRRVNLDKDRSIIDHILSTVRWTMPQYINLSFAPKDLQSRREVLLSTPRTTKLFRGFVKREIEAGVYEIHSEPLSEGGEVIKFIYPYDSSYTILPLSWSLNNEDCLSMHPSRNPSPTPSGPITLLEVIEEVRKGNEAMDVLDSANTTAPSTDSTSAYKPQSSFKLLCEIRKTNFSESDCKKMDEDDPLLENFDEFEPSCWSRIKRSQELQCPEFRCSIDSTSMDQVLSKFRVMDQLEVVHPASDSTICLGRIRKVVYPLLWIQISADSYTLLPFNSTDIYPYKWCEENNHPLVSLLPPRKRINHTHTQQDKKRKRKNNDDGDSEQCPDDQKAVYEKEHFDLGALNDKQVDIDYILNEKTMYIRIYFNHKCFTGPSLSKGKICSLPQYVGPGPLRLVMEEVVTKVISVAYVPPRILNDLSSKSFEELLIARNMTNTAPMEFKAKYQKRVHRENIPVCLNPDDVALYCECICEHLKCCYNLFGPNLYDGDDCPGHCRALTKSNKFMKRAIYYREKARLGEFLNDSGSSKKSSQNNNTSNKTSRARYAGRDSSESTSSSISRSEQVNSRASSAGDDTTNNELKENLVVVKEIVNEEDVKDDLNHDTTRPSDSDIASKQVVQDLDPEATKVLHQTQQEDNVLSQPVGKSTTNWLSESEFMFDIQDSHPENWTIDDVAERLEYCRLGKFKQHMVSESVDGQALLLLDKVAIREHFQLQPKSDYTLEEVGKLCRFVEFVRARAETTT